MSQISSVPAPGAAASPSGALSVFPSLRGRAVFVTGGGSGIGAAIVTAFAEQGARVAFVDVAREASEQLARDIEAAGLPR
ncbi:SDR family NAD(P)-dependent oxidoreductase, partial [Paracidovorax cattleyae]